MKKFFAMMLSVVMGACMLTGCGAKDKTDWEYIKDKGEMIMGITYFEPMNYKDENGELTGFETEFATMVCEKLGVKPVFQKIEWDSKEVELSGKTIDCIWNGLSMTEERIQNMDFSTPYMQNKQVMISKAENADKFKTADDLKDVTVTAEKKSAGEDVVKTHEFFKQAKAVSVADQATALLEVKSGTAEIAVIDYVMSVGTLGEGTDYEDLVRLESEAFAPEQYGIAFRKGSPETVKEINGAIQALADEGKLQELAAKYGLEELLQVKAK